MRLLVITSLLGSATSFADESTEARVGPATKTVPNLAAATQQATPPKQATQKAFWSFPGSWSGAYEVDSGVVSAPGVRTERSAFRQRFLSGARYVSERLNADLSLSVYAYDGVSSSDAEQALVTPIDLHQAYVEYLSPVGLWRLGARRAQWGLGLVAGGRSAYTTLTHHFHFETPSDRTAGLTYAAKMGHVTAGLSGGFVWQDENAEFASGDRAQQAVMVLRYQPSKTAWFGVYGAYRRQRDADDSILEVSLIDTAGEWELPVGASDRLRLAAEVAYLTGRTDRSLSEAAVAAGRDTMDLSALGGALVAGFETMNRRLALELEAGYASADRNPEDNTLNRFTFDDNFGVGMILFPSLLRMSHETSVEQASDLSRVGQPQRGIEHLKTQGRVAGATYLNPRVSYRLGSGSRQVGLHAGAVLAGLPQGSADPYQSFRQGRPVNAFGRDSASDLGIELNAALTWSAKLQRRYAVRLSLEGALAQPGQALSPEDAEPITMVRTGFVLRGLEKEVR